MPLEAIVSIDPLYLYKVNITIHKDIQPEWEAWMLQKHIPDVMKTGTFISFNLLRNVNNAFSYSVLYQCAHLNALNKYLKDWAPDLQEEHRARFEGKFEASRAIYEILEQ